jgi:hypothetical protein
MDFKMIDHALSFVSKWNLRGVELAFAFADAKKVTRVPPEKLRMDFVEK